MENSSKEMVVRQSFPILASSYKGLSVNEVRVFVNFLGRVNLKDLNAENVEVDYTYKELRNIIPGNRSKEYIESILHNLAKTTCTFEVEEKFLTKRGRETVVENVRGMIETSLISVFTEFEEHDEKRVRIRLHKDVAPLILDNSYFRYTLLSFNEFTSLPSKMAQGLYRLLLLNQYEAQNAAPKSDGGIATIKLKKIYKHFGYDGEFYEFFRQLKEASKFVNETHLKHTIDKVYKPGTHTVDALKFIYLTKTMLSEIIDDEGDKKNEEDE